MNEKPEMSVADVLAGGARLLALAYMPLLAGHITGRAEAIFFVFAVLLAMMTAWVNRFRIETWLARVIFGRRESD